MTKISFDVDFSKDPEKILQEIQERAKAEVEKRENKERNAAYLSKLHEQVNEKLGTDYKSISDLIRALTPYAAPSLRKNFLAPPQVGAKTISMSKDAYDEIKKLLAQPNPNKAAIARQTGVSVVQVRKVGDGGFDQKFGGDALSAPKKPVAPIEKTLSSAQKHDVVEEKKLFPSSVPSFEDKKPPKRMSHLSYRLSVIAKTPLHFLRSI